MERTYTARNQCMHVLAVLVFLLGTALSVLSQDVHFSHFTMIPTWVNPAETGRFNGDLRFSGIYRNQWAAIPVPYNTGLFSADYSIQPQQRESTIFGVGLTAFFDQAGDSKYQTIHLSIPISHGFQLTKRNIVHQWIVGISPGILSKRIRIDQLRFDNQFTGEVFDKDLPTGENLEQLSFFDFDMGIGFTYALQTRKDYVFVGGMAVQHIIPIEESFLSTGSSITLNKRYTAYTTITLPVHKKWDVQPQYMMNQQGNLHEHVFGLISSYYLNRKEPAVRAIQFGGYYRVKDAPVLIMSYRHHNWKVGIAYDINTSDLQRASRTYGGFEISAQYIYARVRNMKMNKKIKCVVF